VQLLVKPKTSRGCIITAVQISRRNSRREIELLKGIGIGLCLVVLCLLVAPKTKADEQGSKTVVTFTVPVEVPGVGVQTLPAGTYLFKALDSSPDRDIIQISNPDGTHVFTTFVGSRTPV
jgi:hypothetical protein